MTTLMRRILLSAWAVFIVCAFLFLPTYPTGTTARLLAFLQVDIGGSPNLQPFPALVVQSVRSVCAVAAAVAVAFSARGWGLPLCRFAMVPASHAGWCSFALGGGSLGIFLFGMGLTGILFPAFTLGTAAAGAFIAWRSMRVSAGRAGSAPLRGFAAAAGVITAALWILGVLVPEPGVDAYVYHLRLPFYYQMHHRIFSIWHHIHSQIPQVWDVLLVLFPVSISDTAAQALSALVAVALWSMIVSREGAGWGVRAAGLLFLSSPLVMGIGTSAYTDLTMAWLGFGSFMLLSAGGANPGRGPLFCAGILVGLVCSLKYASFPLAVAAAAWCLAAFWRTKRASCILAPTAGFVLAFWPWWAWNALATGNPVYPFFGKWFPDSLPPLPFAERLGSSVFKRSMLDVFRSPWTAFVRCEPGIFLSPWFIIAFPMMAWRRGAGSVPLGAGLWMGGLLISWSFFIADERFALSAVPVLAMALPGLDGIRHGRAVFAALFLVNGAGCLRQQFLPLSRIWTSLGLESRAAYLRESLSPPAGYFEAAEWLNRNVDRRERILFVSDCRSHYIWRECVHDHVYDYPTRLNYILWTTPRNPGRIAVRMRQLGIRWLAYLPANCARRLRQMPDLFPFKREEALVLYEFWQRKARLRAAFPEESIYEITPGMGRPADSPELPGVQDAAFAIVDEIRAREGDKKALEILGRLVETYPRVGAFHAALGQVLLSGKGGPSRIAEGRGHLERAAKAGWKFGFPLP